MRSLKPLAKPPCSSISRRNKRKNKICLLSPAATVRIALARLDGHRQRKSMRN